MVNVNKISNGSVLFLNLIRVFSNNGKIITNIPINESIPGVRVLNRCGEEILTIIWQRKRKQMGH